MPGEGASRQTYVYVPTPHALVSKARRRVQLWGLHEGELRVGSVCRPHCPPPHPDPPSHPLRPATSPALSHRPCSCARCVACVRPRGFPRLAIRKKSAGAAVVGDRDGECPVGDVVALPPPLQPPVSSCPPGRMGWQHHHPSGGGGMLLPSAKQHRPL